MPDPKPQDLFDQYPPDARDDLRRIAERMEFLLTNFCTVADKSPQARYHRQLRQLLDHIVDPRNHNPSASDS